MQSGEESLIKKITSYAIGLLIVVVLIFLPALVLHGMVWFSDKTLLWLVRASQITLLVCIFIFLPLCAFQKVRPWAGVGFVYASFIFGAMLFAYSCLFVVDEWGYTGLFIGLIFAGVGVVPVGLLAALIHAEWRVLAEILFGGFLTFGARYIGLRLTTRREEESVLVDSYGEQ